MDNSTIPTLEQLRLLSQAADTGKEAAVWEAAKAYGIVVIETTLVSPEWHVFRVDGQNVFIVPQGFYLFLKELVSQPKYHIVLANLVDFWLMGNEKFAPGGKKFVQILFDNY